MKKLFIAIAAVTLLVGCRESVVHNIENTMPSRPTDEVESDMSTRFESPQLSMFYNDGGILASSSVEPGKTELTMTDISNGDVVQFSATGDIKSEAISSPRLTINGETVKIASIETRYIKETGAWIKLQTPDAVEMIFVMSD